MVKQLTDEEITFRKSERAMMHILGLKWGEGIPYLPGTENLKDRVECYTVYMPLLQKNMKQFGVDERNIPTLEQCLSMVDSLDGSENRVFTERPVWSTNFDENREDLTEAYMFGAFQMFFKVLLFSKKNIAKNILRTIEPIKAGTELKIHYDMDMEFAPEWYMVSGINYSVVKKHDFFHKFE